MKGKNITNVWLTDIISYNLETNYCRVFCNYSKAKRCLLPSMRLLDMWMQHLSFSQKIYFGVVSQTLNWTNLADCCTNNHIQKAAERNSFVFYSICFF